MRSTLDDLNVGRGYGSTRRGGGGRKGNDAEEGYDTGECQRAATGEAERRLQSVQRGVHVGRLRV